MTNDGIVEYVFKVPLVGFPQSGKTALTRAFMGQMTDPGLPAMATVGVDFSSKLLKNVDATSNVRLQLWDCAGDPALAAPMETTHRNASAAIVVFDVNNAASLEHAEQVLIPALGQFEVPPSRILLVGNKVDIRDSGRGGVNGAAVSRDQGRMVAKRLGVEFTEVCCVDGRGVAEAFNGLALRLADVYRATFVDADSDAIHLQFDEEDDMDATVGGQSATATYAQSAVSVASTRAGVDDAKPPSARQSRTSEFDGQQPGASASRSNADDVEEHPAMRRNRKRPTEEGEGEKRDSCGCCVIS